MGARETFKYANAEPIFPRTRTNSGGPVKVKTFTLTELAREMGLTTSGMSRICAGERMPSAHKVAKLARILGEPMDRIYEDLAQLGDERAAGRAARGQLSKND